MIATSTCALELPNVTLYLSRQDFEFAKGNLILSLIQLPFPPSYEEDTHSSNELYDQKLLMTILNDESEALIEFPITKAHKFTKELQQRYRFLMDVTILQPYSKDLNDEEKLIEVELRLDDISQVNITLFEGFLQRFGTFQIPLANSEDSIERIAIQTEELRNQLILLDENGQLVATVDPTILESASVTIEEKEGNEVVIIETDSTKWQPSEESKNDNIVLAADYLSFGLVKGSEGLGWILRKGSQLIVDNTKPTENPLQFSEKTRNNIESSHKLSTGAYKVSSTLIGFVGQGISAAGGVIGKSVGIQPSPNDPPLTGYKAYLASSLLAINSIGNALDLSTQVLLNSSGEAGQNIVDHSFGADAAELSHLVGSSLRNLVLVYVDAQGVSRKAILKGLGGGAVASHQTGVGKKEEKMKVQSDFCKQKKKV